MKKLVQCLVVCALVGAALSAHAARGGAAKDAPKVQGVVNLNQADLDQLALLPGVGPTKARRIVEWRAKHPFKRIEELTRVKGFGRKSFARLKTNLAVAGPTTLQRVKPAAASPATTAGATPAPSAAPWARTAPAPQRPTR
jgi:competence protein ComEA